MPINKRPGHLPDPKVLVRRAREHLVRVALVRLRAILPFYSRTLARSLEVTEDGLWLPHYWARFLHDGRGFVRPKNFKTVSYYPDISDDPRVQGGARYPVSPEDIVHHTLEQYREGIRSGKLIATRRGTGPAPRTGFFEEGMQGTMAVAQAGGEIAAMVDAWVLGQVPEGEETIEIRL